MDNSFKPNVKFLVEALLNKLDPSANVEVICEYADEIGEGGKELQLFDAGYRDGKFVIKVIEWL